MPVNSGGPPAALRDALSSGRPQPSPDAAFASLPRVCAFSGLLVYMPSSAPRRLQTEGILGRDAWKLVCTGGGLGKASQVSPSLSGFL